MVNFIVYAVTSNRNNCLIKPTGSLMAKNKLVTALSPLKPFRVTDVNTGEILNSHTTNATLGSLIDYCREQAISLYEQNEQKVLADVLDYRSNANAFGRGRGYVSGYKSLSRDILAKSRINELVLFKLISETASFAKNPNPRKQAHSFNKTINLGSVDKQMASLAYHPEEKVLTLLFKCWDKELLLEFNIPPYILKYDIKKWSLPVIRKQGDEYVFLFTIQENIPTRPTGKHKAGLDLGIVEPYIIAVTNEKGGRVAHYTASPFVKKLSRKRDRLLSEKKFLNQKIKAYVSLGLDADTLEKHKSLVSQKSARLGKNISQHLGSEIAKKLHKHYLNTLNVENLTWVSGTKDSKIGSSRWSHSSHQEKISHALLRVGISVKKVSPRNSSRSCHKCGTTLMNRARSVYCTKCKVLLDRDYNAAMNIATLKHLNCPPINNITGNNSSPTGQVMEESLPNSILGHYLLTSLVT